MTETNAYITTKEAAEILNISDKTVRNLCRDRKIKHERLNGRNIRLTREWVEEYRNSIIIEPIKEETNNERSND